jgi:hypothetical protein
LNGQHADLIARLADAAGPDPALDREVALALGWRPSAVHANRWTAPDDVPPEDAAEPVGAPLWLDQWLRPRRGPWRDADMRWPIEPPPFTGCADAALYGLDPARVGIEAARLPGAGVWTVAVGGEHRAAAGRGATLPLALCQARVWLAEAEAREREMVAGEERADA